MLIDIEPVLNRFRNTPEPPYLEKPFQEWLKTVGIIETLPNDHKDLVGLRNNTAELLKRGGLSLQNCLLVMLMEEEGTLVSRGRLIQSLYNGHKVVSETKALKMIHYNLRDKLENPELLLDSSQAGVCRMHVTAVGITRVRLGLNGWKLLHHIWSKVKSDEPTSSVELALVLYGYVDIWERNAVKSEICKLRKVLPFLRTVPLLKRITLPDGVHLGTGYKIPQGIGEV